jgi:hypothetical protein
MGTLWQSLMLAIAVAVPAVAAAQPPARTFDELAKRLGRADEVWITDAGGKESKSTVVTIGSSTLTVNTKHGPLDLQAADIVRVRQKQPDPIWNGILIGVVSGAAYPLWYFSKGYETGESLKENVEGVLMAGAIGGCIGAWIDSRVRGRRIIYERPARSARFTIAPALSRRALGVSVAMTLKE